MNSKDKRYKHDTKKVKLNQFGIGFNFNFVE